MTKQETFNSIVSVGIVPVVRIADGDQIMDAADALIEGGIAIMEVTMSSTRPFETIRRLKLKYGEKLLVGLGSVLNKETAEKGVAAGAEFLVSPIFKQEVLEAAQKHGKLSVLGSLTPTEIQSSFEAGTDIIKVFPATKFGPGYFKDILAPMPHLKLTPTGGVDLGNVAEFIKNGAVCVGVGTALLRKDLIEEKDWDGLKNLATAFCKEVVKGRA